MILYSNISSGDFTHSGIVNFDGAALVLDDITMARNLRDVLSVFC